MSIDNDIQLEKICHKCQKDLDKNSCSVCNTNLDEQNDNTNPQFDEELFEKLKRDSRE